MIQKTLIAGNLFLSLLACSLFACDSQSENNKGGSRDVNATQCVPTQEDQQEVQPVSYGVVNGQQTSEYPAVVMLTMQVGPDFGVCTGTFIGHNVLVTAGHCVDESEVSQIKVHIGPQHNPGNAFRSPSTIQILQKISALPVGLEVGIDESVSKDIAILLTGPNAAPAIANIRQTNVPNSSDLKIVGYGMLDDNSTDGVSIKRWAQNS